MSILDKNDLGRLKGIIEKAGLPTKMPDLELEKITQAMKHDKKVRRDKIRFVLLKSVGSAFITDEVDVSLVEKVLVNEKT